MARWLVYFAFPILILLNTMSFPQGKAPNKSKPNFNDPKDFCTNQELLEQAGLLWNKSTPLRPVVALLLLTTGSLHYALRIALTYQELPPLQIIKIVHLLSAYLTIGISSFVAVSQSQRFLRLADIIREGFYTYPQGLTQEQLNFRVKANENILRIAKYMLRSYIFGIFLSIFKEPVPHDFEKWRKAYVGWFPFVVDSWPKYVLTQIFHVFAGLSVYACSAGICLVFITLAEHLLAQLKILSISLKDALKDTPDANDLNAKRQAYLRIRSCIQHHQVILSFFSELQTYYSITLLVMPGITTISMCTWAYVITDPRTSLGVNIAFMGMLAPEVACSVIYCIYGQWITDLGFEVRDTVYNSPWYCQPKEVEQSCWLILLKTRAPLTLVAAGLKECSVEAIADSAQATYTYFNALQIFRASST